MKRSKTRHTYKLLILLLIVPLLTGAKCVFWFSSDDSDRDKPPPEKPEDTVKAGQVGGIPVEGLRYESGTLSGITGPDGGFEYEADGDVRLFLGDIPMGEPVPGKALITLIDLVPGANDSTPQVVNMVRLLMSLDAVQGDEAITIPRSVEQAARRDDELAGASIEYLDFKDEAAFSNAASQLVAVLTSDYPFTASLVETDIARDYLERAKQKAVASE